MDRWRLIITSFIWLLHYSPKVVPLKLFSTYPTWNLPLHYLKSKCPLRNKFLKCKELRNSTKCHSHCILCKWWWPLEKFKEAAWQGGKFKFFKNSHSHTNTQYMFHMHYSMKFSNSVRQILLTKIKDEKLRLSITN